MKPTKVLEQKIYKMIAIRRSLISEIRESNNVLVMEIREMIKEAQNETDKKTKTER